MFFLSIRHLSGAIVGLPVRRLFRQTPRLRIESDAFLSRQRKFTTTTVTFPYPNLSSLFFHLHFTFGPSFLSFLFLLSFLSFLPFFQATFLLLFFGKPANPPTQANSLQLQRSPTIDRTYALFLAPQIINKSFFFLPSNVAPASISLVKVTGPLSLACPQCPPIACFATSSHHFFFVFLLKQSFTLKKPLNVTFSCWPLLPAFHRRQRLLCTFSLKFRFKPLFQSELTFIWFVNY